MEKSEEKRPLGRPRSRWENGIKMDLTMLERFSGDMEWSQLDQDRDRWRALVNKTLSLLVLAPRLYFILDAMRI
jgi:hypothetical protein